MDYYVLQVLNCDTKEVLSTFKCSSIELGDVIASSVRSGYLVQIQPYLFDVLK